jgi:hypothetical protein
MKKNISRVIVIVRLFTLLSSIFMLLLTIILYSMKSTPYYGAIFFLPFYGFPIIIIGISSFFLNRIISYIFLLLSLLLYGIFFVYTYYNAFYLHLDPQSGLIILFVGVYSLPVMIPLWVTVFFINYYHNSPINKNDV